MPSPGSDKGLSPSPQESPGSELSWAHPARWSSGPAFLAPRLSPESREVSSRGASTSSRGSSKADKEKGPVSSASRALQHKSGSAQQQQQKAAPAKQPAAAKAGSGAELPGTGSPQPPSAALAQLAAAGGSVLDASTDSMEGQPASQRQQSGRGDWAAQVMGNALFAGASAKKMRSTGQEALSEAHRDAVRGTQGADVPQVRATRFQSCPLFLTTLLCFLSQVHLC